MNKKIVAVLLVVIISTVIVVAYAVLTSQSPVVHRTGVVTSTNCAVWNVASEQPGSASGYVVPAGPGDVLFNCSGSAGVITVSTVGTAIPTFVLPSGYAVMAVIPHMANPSNTV